MAQNGSTLPPEIYNNYILEGISPPPYPALKCGNCAKIILSLKLPKIKKFYNDFITIKKYSLALTIFFLSSKIKIQKNCMGFAWLNSRQIVALKFHSIYLLI